MNRRPRLTDEQSRVLAVLPELARRPGINRAPTVQEVAEHTDLPIGNVYVALLDLRDSGHIRVAGRNSIEVVERPALRLIRGAA